MNIIFLSIGIVAGMVIIFFIFRANSIPRKLYDEVQQNKIQIDADFKNAQNIILEKEKILAESKEQCDNLSSKCQNLMQELSNISAEHKNITERYAESRETLNSLQVTIAQLTKESQNYFAQISELKAKNENLTILLDTQKEEMGKIQEESRLQFENIANKILEEKTEKFTSLNKENLGQILKPLGEDLEKFKKRVNEVYENEARERHSLRDTIKIMLEQTSKISREANNLATALKGQSKTQGNWGEMILENILEKSGLQKDREYFMEYELRNEDNTALLSEFSGRKMRPDAIVKYPGNRTVIIDSKVSLKAFSEVIDEADPDIYAAKLSRHLLSVKNHIDELSRKAYDDYDKSLDFVVMFIPSEPAYIAAMQSDPNLWSYAYEKRILLMNPSNLITSLKLIVNLWKREYQNQNAAAIADRGTKLYHKFVGFVENLEKVGKNIDQAKNAYEEAYKQLYSGNDNLIRQTEKLKELGIKTKKSLSTDLIKKISE